MNSKTYSKRPLKRNSTVTAVVASLLLAWPVCGQAKPVVPPRQAASASSAAVAQRPAPRLVEQGSYINRDGSRVHVPAHTVDGAEPQGASARCRDGSWSISAHRSGTCSHHGGVARRL